MMKREERESRLIDALASYLNLTPTQKTACRWIAALPLTDPPPPSFVSYEMSNLREGLTLADFLSGSRWTEAEQLKAANQELLNHNGKLSDELRKSDEKIRSERISTKAHIENAEYWKKRALGAEESYLAVIGNPPDVVFYSTPGNRDEHWFKTYWDGDRMRREPQLHVYRAAGYNPNWRMTPMTSRPTETFTPDDRVVIGYDMGRKDGDYGCTVEYTQRDGKLRILSMTTIKHK